jgi:hypothetical protein
METTYTIEFMRLAEPPLAPIKLLSAFHVTSLLNARFGAQRKWRYYWKQVF